jgi:hypothetical protein
VPQAVAPNPQLLAAAIRENATMSGELISLLSGAGGLDLGAERSGFEVKAARFNYRHADQSV